MPPSTARANGSRSPVRSRRMPTARCASSRNRSSRSTSRGIRMSTEDQPAEPQRTRAEARAAREAAERAAAAAAAAQEDRLEDPPEREPSAEEEASPRGSLSEPQARRNAVSEERSDESKRS